MTGAFEASNIRVTAGTETTRHRSLVWKTSSCVYISVVTYFSYIKEFRVQSMHPLLENLWYLHC